MLLLVDGRVAGIPLQLLGDNLSVCVSRDQRALNHRVVLSGLFRRLSLLDRHPVSFSQRLFGGRRAANGLHQIASALHELDDLLY